MVTYVVITPLLFPVVPDEKQRYAVLFLYCSGESSSRVALRVRTSAVENGWIPRIALSPNTNIFRFSIPDCLLATNAVSRFSS